MKSFLRNLSKHLILWLILVFILQLLVNAEVYADKFEDVPGWPGIDDIRASAFSVYDATTDEFLLDRNMHEPLWNASTTKVMTALTVVNHEKFDLDAKLLVSPQATYFADPQSVRMQLKAGELITTRDALAGLLVQSANDCAYVLAENYGGFYGYTSDLPPEQWDNLTEESVLASRQVFVDEMNRIAQKLGAVDTNFDNPCGWDGETHQTTAHDLTLMSKALLDNEVLAGYVSLAHYMPEPTNMHPYAGWAFLNNSNSLVLYGTNFFQSQYISRYNGVKTGTTPLAGNCLIGAGITHDGHQIIAVLLGGSVYRPDDNSYVRIAIPVRTLLEYGAFLSGSSSKPYQEAALPSFSSPLGEDEVTDDPGVTELPDDKNPDISTAVTTEMTIVTDTHSEVVSSRTEMGISVKSDKGNITQREKFVIAFSALIVICAIAIVVGNYIFNRKIKNYTAETDDHKQNDEITSKLDK